MKALATAVSPVFAFEGIDSKPVDKNVQIKASYLKNIDGLSSSTNSIIKIEDVVDGKRIVCYGLASTSYDGGKSLTGLQVMKDPAAAGGK